MKRVIQAIVLPLAILIGAPSGEALAQVPVESCRGEGEDPQKVSVSWLSVPSESSVATLSTSDTILLVTNQRAANLYVELKAIMRAGGERAELSLGTIPISATSVATAIVPLSGFGIDISNLQYSGSVFVEARFVDAAGAQVDRAYSAPVFFHRDGTSAGAVVYGGEAKSTYFNAGDLYYNHVRSPGPHVGGVFDGGDGDGSMNEDWGPTDLSAGPSEWEFCLRWVYQSIDSGFELPSGVSEDYYISGHLMKARGMKITISHPNWNAPIEDYANLVNGCYAFEAAENSGFEVTIHAEAKLGTSNNIVLRGFKDGDAYADGMPTQWTFTANPGGTPRRVYYQNEASDVSNLMAFGSFTFHWVDSHTSPGLAGPSTLNFVTEVFNDPLCTEACRVGDAIWIKPGAVTQEKFGVAHEVGHWIHGMWTNNNTGGFWGQYDYNDPDEAECSYVTPMDGPGGHAMRSKEPASGAYIEGLAHYIAALAWNDHDQTEGLFKYYKETILTSAYDDMEATDWLVDLEGAGANPVGGVSSWFGAKCDVEPGFSVEMDWLRFFWDYRTNAPAQQNDPIPDHHDVFDLVRFTMANHAWNNMGGVYPSFLATFNDQLFNQPASFEARWTGLASQNGVAQ
jgi:hypothetical protein